MHKLQYGTVNEQQISWMSQDTQTALQRLLLYKISLKRPQIEIYKEELITCFLSLLSALTFSTLNNGTSLCRSLTVLQESTSLSCSQETSGSGFTHSQLDLSVLSHLLSSPSLMWATSFRPLYYPFCLLFITKCHQSRLF